MRCLAVTDAEFGELHLCQSQHTAIRQGSSRLPRLGAEPRGYANFFLAVYVHGCAEPERTSADYKEPVGERLVENPATNRATVLLDFTLINLGETLPPQSCYFRIDNNRFIVTCGKRRRISARMRAAGWQATARKLFRPHRRRWKQSTKCFTVPVAD